MFNLKKRATPASASPSRPDQTLTEVLQAAIDEPFRVTSGESGSVIIGVEAENFDIGEQVAAKVMTDIGPGRSVIVANRYTVAAHLETAAKMMEGLEARKAALLEEARIFREEFEAREAARNGELDEVERLMAFYSKAPELTMARARMAPVDPVAMNAVGDKIAATIASVPVDGKFQFGGQWYRVVRAGTRGSKKIGKVFAIPIEAPQKQLLTETTK